jgi:hypothetical protein
MTTDEEDAERVAVYPARSFYFHSVAELAGHFATPHPPYPLDV